MWCTYIPADYFSPTQYIYIWLSFDVCIYLHLNRENNEIMRNHKPTWSVVNKNPFPLKWPEKSTWTRPNCLWVYPHRMFLIINAVACLSWNAQLGFVGLFSSDVLPITMLFCLFYQTYPLYPINQIFLISCIVCGSDVARSYRLLSIGGWM